MTAELYITISMYVYIVLGLWLTWASWINTISEHFAKQVYVINPIGELIL